MIADLLSHNFLLRALFAGILLAIISGVMGCFVVWRRMAYFSDSVAHSALLGVVIGIAVGINVTFGTLLVGMGFACLLLWLQHSKLLTNDSALGILAHGALALGIVATSLIQQGRPINLHLYLFGDILTIANHQLYWLGGATILLLAVLYYYWAALLLFVMHQDLAIAERVKVLRLQMIFNCLLVLLVAVAIPIVGVLLISAMLIIPAATARQYARSPEIMAGLAVCFGIFAVLMGIYASYQFDTPSGPSIVSSAFLVFLLVFVGRYLWTVAASFASGKK